MTWYQGDQSDVRRIQVTFQDSLRKNFKGAEKLPGEIELYGDSKEAPLGRMSIDNPDALDQLARAISIAAQHWRHCIEECPCFDEQISMEIDLGSIDLSSYPENPEDNWEDPHDSE